ncbi:MAG: MBL fold metallo-hydrolase [Gammaproteobacteria bacterium]|nr:MBL fold metallo-hydrolase [Gammaproteobacteria bacterium]MCD8542733.1 MBL fold metallo-hydrolase [Gammaproteobacteria bacterium]
MSIEIKPFFDQETATFTYVVSDVKGKVAAVIDPVLNYDQYAGRMTTHAADEVIAYITAQQLTLQWILETHIHADHITAASYIKEKLGGFVGIGKKITTVLEYWVPVFNTSDDTPLDGSQFDCLFDDKQQFFLGESVITVWHTPGHTPACCSYLIDDNIFVGDTIFMPDIGTARTDFPGGSAEDLYSSIKRILNLSPHTNIFVGHDYPPVQRDKRCNITVQEQRQTNILVNDTVSQESYVQNRHQRDQNKAVPKLLLPSIQANLRLGRFSASESNGIQYIKIPINSL